MMYPALSHIFLSSFCVGVGARVPAVVPDRGGVGAEVLVVSDRRLLLPLWMGKERPSQCGLGRASLANAAVVSSLRGSDKMLSSRCGEERSCQRLARAFSRSFFFSPRGG